MDLVDADIFWGDLKAHLELLDVGLTPLITEIRASEGVIDHKMDRAEYLIGAGFVAIQKYMLEICHWRRIRLKDAIRSGAPFEKSVWAAANFWKHESEWWQDVSQKAVNKSPSNNKPKPMERNLETLSDFGAFPNDFVCSNVLAAYSPSNELLLSSLLPRVLEWKKSLPQ